MCGLTGILGQSSLNSDHAQNLITLMNDQIAHRGPDGREVWSEGPIALGHRRLSILDLSPAGQQPMTSASGRYVIAFNGEIYNHLHMRQNLEHAKAAPEWIGHSDTETLLAAIEHYGLDDALKKTSGMFALALWDRKLERLSLARDRMGEKPLYWGWAGHALVFGSELKSLRVHPDFNHEIDRASVVQFLRFNYIPAPRSIYRDAFKLEPGCIMEVNNLASDKGSTGHLRPGQSSGGLSIRRYWSLENNVIAGAANPITNPTEAVNALEAALTRSVEEQMLSDVPLGAFLSGGVDSSAIVALMQKISPQPIKTFTIGFDKPDFDESPHAARVAQHLGTDHHTLRVTEQDARDVIPSLPTLYDEPFADSSKIPMHLVCRAAREKVTVALSGDAGDELFGGYNRYLWGPKIWSRIENIPAPIRKALGGAISAIPIAAWDSLGQVYSRIGNSASGVAQAGIKAHRIGDVLRQASGEDGFYKHLVSSWNDPASLVIGETHEAASQIEDPLPEAELSHLAARMAYQDMRSYLPDDILCKVDRAAMGISLETRAPFLSAEMLALSARMPIDIKIRNKVGKWPLRQVLYRHVPKEMIERPKAGFAIPIGSWLRGPLREWAEDLLSEDSLKKTGILDPAMIRPIWAEHLDGKRDWNARLWPILMLQSWLQH